MKKSHNYLSALITIDQFQSIYDNAKAVALSLGAKPETFTDADEKLQEIKRDILKNVSGGFVAKVSPCVHDDGSKTYPA